MGYGEKLKRILFAANWTQQRLANEIGVSFPTLNSWVNKKSMPRTKMKQKIDEVFALVAGESEIDLVRLKALKKTAVNCKYSLAELTKNRELFDNLTSGFTFHSNGTEGSTMTESDVRRVLFDNEVLSNRTAIEQREAVNHKIALEFLLDEIGKARGAFRFSEDILLDVHQRLMSGIISNAGIYRNHPVRITGSKVVTPNFMKIPGLVEGLVDELNENSNDKINLLAKTHARFEAIHPFTDGNGRVGRIVLFAKALDLGIVPPIIRKYRRIAYYTYLELAQTKEQYGYLEQLICQEIIQTSEQFTLSERSDTIMHNAPTP